jgi:hypothetical protein
MIDECGVVGEMRMVGETEVLRENPLGVILSTIYPT